METEFKFVVPRDRLAAVEAALRRGRVLRTRLQARYFDTPERLLAAHGIALRLRKEGRRWVQTVKGAGDGLLQREEHNVDLGVARVGVVPQPDVRRHHGTPVGERLARLLAEAGAPLVERYATDIWRLTRRVRAGGSTVELALDIGTVTAGAGTPGARTSQVCELELELVRGRVADLVALAQRWSGAHGLWFSTVSKAERGERLCAPLPVGAPGPQAMNAVPAVKATPPRLGAGADGRAVQRAVLAACLAQLLPNASELAAGSLDAEQLHQLRIGLRRLRTALRELRPLDAPAFADAEAWAPPLVAAFQALGALRDREQVLARIAPRLQAAGAPAIALAPPDAAVVGQLSPGEIVRAPAFQAVLVALIGFTATEAAPPALEGEGAFDARATRRALRQRLQRLHAQTVRDGRRFAALATAQQHRVRKRLKRLRYLAEFVAPLFKGTHAGRYRRRLTPAQDVLGAFNDEAVAEALYREVAAHDPAAWFAVGWLSARRDAGAVACRQALSALAEGPRFWRKKD